MFTIYPLKLVITYFIRFLFGFCPPKFFPTNTVFDRVRRRQNQEDTLHQRYAENKDKKSKEEKDIQNKHTEKETSAREDKPVPCVAQKAKMARVAADPGREKMLRPLVERWKRQDSTDFREKRCFICGREGHIRKECPQFKGSPGTEVDRTLIFVLTSQRKSC